MMRQATLMLVLLCVSPLLAGDGDDPADVARKRFWEARKILVAGDPASAAELFRTIHLGNPKTEVADDCLYWMGRCYLRLPDHEAAAVSALNRLIRDYPQSPFLDEAVRELDRLGEREVVKDLKERLKRGGADAEVTARALAEFGDEAGIGWLRDKDIGGAWGERKRERPLQSRDDLAKEVERLRAEVKRLRAEVEATLALVKKLVERREASGEDGK